MKWKRDFLVIDSLLEDFWSKHLTEAVIGQAEDNGGANVLRLLRHHTTKTRALLSAHVNGCIDDHYKEEADKLT